MELTLSAIPEKEALRYLGVKGDVPPELLGQVQAACRDLLPHCRVRYVWRQIAKTDLPALGLDLLGEYIHTLLRDCETAVLFALTLGEQAEMRIRRAGLRSPTDALVLDACASAACEAACDKLQAMLELVAQQLLDRFEIQANKHIYNYPFLMGQGIWLDSDKLNLKDDLREVLKHGTLSIGFIGLAETLTALYGQHHGETEEIQKKGLEIIGFMRKYCDQKSQELKMNFSLLATPAEGLSGRFIRMDQKRYGKLPGITDREYYTNSFHIPVWYSISVYDKIRLEAPYHALCNAGHISYVELDGDTARNVEAFEAVVRCMHDHGIGYGSINHPVDRDPVCGYVGIIGDVCPRCGRREGEEIPFERVEELRKMHPEMPAFQGIE